MEVENVNVRLSVLRSKNIDIEIPTINVIPPLSACNILSRFVNLIYQANQILREEMACPLITLVVVSSES